MGYLLCTIPRRQHELCIGTDVENTYREVAACTYIVEYLPILHDCCIGRLVPWCLYCIAYMYAEISKPIISTIKSLPALLDDKFPPKMSLFDFHNVYGADHESLNGQSMYCHGA